MKAKVQFKAIGTCAKCGREIIRPSECTHAVCYHNPEPVIITLEPALIVPDKLLEPYQKIAESAQVSVEDLVNKVLEVGIEEKLKETRK